MFTLEKFENNVAPTKEYRAIPASRYFERLITCSSADKTSASSVTVSCCSDAGSYDNDETDENEAK